MDSTFSWLDHSEEQRQKMMEVVGLFKEKGTVDELGIGSVRDTLSEVLFPGTSTLHTRARYLLFLPWICLGIEHDRVPSHRAPQRLRGDEVRLIFALETGGEREGVIGIEAGANLKQVPSQMYWSALRRYGIRLLNASSGQYLRSLDGFYASSDGQQHADDGELLLDSAPRNWHVSLPSAPDGFLDETSFDLTLNEADYLTERIVDRCGSTYLAHLVLASDQDVEGEFPWLSPALDSAPARVREDVEHARNFSEILHGASLLYNLILSEKIRDARSASGDFAVDADLVDEYRQELDDWVELMAHRREPRHDWDRAAFWERVTRQNPRVPSPTIRFVNRWIDLAVARPEAVPDDEQARQLIANREIFVKRALARVANLRALERWQGASGRSQLEFRWSQVADVVSDIARGRDREVADART